MQHFQRRSSLGWFGVGFVPLFLLVLLLQLYSQVIPSTSLAAGALPAAHPASTYMDPQHPHRCWGSSSLSKVCLALLASIHPDPLLMLTLCLFLAAGRGGLQCFMSRRCLVLTEMLTGQTVVLKCYFSSPAHSLWILSPPAAPLAFISPEPSKQILSLHLLHLWE